MLRFPVTLDCLLAHFRCDLTRAASTLRGSTPVFHLTITQIICLYLHLFLSFPHSSIDSETFPNINYKESLISSLQWSAEAVLACAWKTLLCHTSYAKQLEKFLWPQRLLCKVSWFLPRLLNLSLPLQLVHTETFASVFDLKRKEKSISYVLYSLPVLFSLKANSLLPSRALCAGQPVFEKMINFTQSYSQESCLLGNETLQGLPNGALSLWIMYPCISMVWGFYFKPFSLPCVQQCNIKPDSFLISRITQIYFYVSNHFH